MVLVDTLVSVGATIALRRIPWPHGLAWRNSGEHPTYGHVADVADAVILNRGGEMDTRVAARAGHAGADTGRRSAPACDRRSPVERRIIALRRLSRKQIGMENELSRSSMRFQDWYGLRSLTDTSTS